MAVYALKPSPFTRFWLADTRSAWVWLAVRLYLGWGWLSAGWDKATGTGWVGGQAGSSLTGFMQGALAKTSGAHPDVQWWYVWFIHNAVLPYVTVWSYAIVCGEMLVGLGLIFGCLTGVAAFFGAFMDLNFMFAGTVSLNPEWFVLGLGLALAWRVAGHWGLDYWVMPRVFNVPLQT